MARSWATMARRLAGVAGNSLQKATAEKIVSFRDRCLHQHHFTPSGKLTTRLPLIASIISSLMASKPGADSRSPSLIPCTANAPGVIGQVGFTLRFRRMLPASSTTAISMICGTTSSSNSPVPLQFGHSELEGPSGERLNLDLGRFTKDQKTATQKLFNHFANIGFVRLPNTPFALASTLRLRNKLDVE